MLCWGDTPGPLLRRGVLLPDCDGLRDGVLVAMGSATEDGDGGSSTRCRFRGAVPSSLISLPDRPSWGGFSVDDDEALVGG